MAAIRRSNRMILGAGHPPFVFARVATGGIRHRPMVERSGAVRADCPAVLTGRAHRATHCVQTGAMRMTTKRAVRAALPAPLLGAPQWACAGYRMSRRWASGVPCTQDQSPKPGVYLALRQPAAWLRRPVACLDDFSGAGKSKNRWTGLSLFQPPAHDLQNHGVGGKALQHPRHIVRLEAQVRRLALAAAGGHGVVQAADLQRFVA
jgi:hypothetical protein